jgi:hypothetical protein
LKNLKQEKNERMEVYYERSLKSTNILQDKIINNFLINNFKIGLQPYLRVATVGTKRKTL